MMIRLLLLLLFVTQILSQEKAARIQQEIKKNSAIIKQKKRKEKSILKELGNLRTNIYLTQKKLNQAYKKYNSYQQQIKDTEIKLTTEKQRLTQTKDYLNLK